MYRFIQWREPRSLSLQGIAINKWAVLIGHVATMAKPFKTSWRISIPARLVAAARCSRQFQLCCYSVSKKPRSWRGCNVSSWHPYFSDLVLSNFCTIVPGIGCHLGVNKGLKSSCGCKGFGWLGSVYVYAIPPTKHPPWVSLTPKTRPPLWVSVGGIPHPYVSVAWRCS